MILKWNNKIMEMTSNNDKVNDQQKHNIVAIQNICKTLCANNKSNNGINKNKSHESKTNRKAKV